MQRCCFVLGAIPVTFTIVPRSSIGVPDPAAAGRAKLARPLSHVLVHYTGGAGYNDPTQDVAYAKRVAAFGIANNKKWEYNYLIGLGGTVFEQGGDYMGAHCANFNSKSIGVLVMIGIGVQPTTPQIDAFRQLRKWLTDTGRIAATADVVPHYRYRSTACPGLTLADPPGASWSSPTGEGRLGDVIDPLLKPWSVTVAAPTVVVPLPTVKLGSTGSNVRQLQQVMAFWGWYAAAVDGLAGAKTVESIKRLQVAVKVSADGVYGPVTAAAYKVWVSAMTGLVG